MVMEDLRSWLLRFEHSQEQTVAALTGKISKLEEEIAQLCEENSVLQHETEFTGEVAQSQREKKLVAKLAELQGIIQEFSLRWEETQVREKVLSDLRDHLHAENVSLQNRIAMQQEDICGLIANLGALAKLRTAIEDKEAAEEETHSVLKQMKKMKEENMMLQRQLKAARQTMVKCEEEVFLKTQQMEYIRGYVHYTQNHFADDSEVLQQAVDKADFELLQDKYSNLKVKYKELKGEKAATGARLMQMKLAYKRIKEKQSVLTQQLTCAIPSEQSLEMLEEDLKNLERRIETEEMMNQSKETSLYSYDFDSDSEYFDTQSDKTPAQLEKDISELQEQISGLLIRLETLGKVESLVYKYFPDTTNVVETLTKVLLVYQREVTSHKSRKGLYYTPRNASSRGGVSLVSELLLDEKKQQGPTLSLPSADVFGNGGPTNGFTLGPVPKRGEKRGGDLVVKPDISAVAKRFSGVPGVKPIGK